MTCLSLCKKDRSCSITIVNSGLRSLSASSITKVLHWLRSATPLPAKSSIRPGVPTTTWTVSWSRKISSLSVVPPVVTIICMPVCFPKVLQTCEVWRASSRVGTRIRAWIRFNLTLVFSSVGMTKAPVCHAENKFQPEYSHENIKRRTHFTGSILIEAMVSIS